MEIKCPYCGKLFNAPPEDAGRMAACTACHGRFQIPAPVAELADPALARQPENQGAPVLDPAPAATATGEVVTAGPGIGALPTGAAGVGGERQVWQANPSQWIGFKVYAWCFLFAAVLIAAGVLVHPWFFAGLVLPVLFAFSSLVRIKSIHYSLTTQRLKITAGLVSRRVVEIELFRIRDLSVEQTFLQRMAGIGHVQAISSDKDAQAIHLVGVRHPQDVKEQLRTFVMESRRTTGTRDIDLTNTVS
ncbi:MAG TPA: PH domain-containing protein [Pirellulales bacterium]|jgi:membrane protein YdbS with pleckstrin-like domain|nr:PH domain-containing protein [Pirellulales bacterium]